MMYDVDLEHPELGPSHDGSSGSQPLYGVQFHPERHRERHPDGRIILASFLRLAGFAASRPEAAALARA